MEADRAEHWDNAYVTKGERGVSWFEENPGHSLESIRSIAGRPPLSVIDVGGGASRLVDAGLREGWRIAVLDVSGAALDTARKRLGRLAAQVEWIRADVTRWQPQRSFDVWHDRAAFHFLTEADDRAAYVERLLAALSPGGHAIIATFAPDGPQRCSGLPVRRYDASLLAEILGSAFQFVAEHRFLHTTPWDSTQSFQLSIFRRIGRGYSVGPATVAPPVQMRNS